MTDKSMFTPLDGAFALLRSKGVYTDAALYAYKDKLYARHRLGFIRLLAHSLTSVANITWQSIEGVEFIQAYDGLQIVPAGAKVIRKLKQTKVAEAA